MKLSDLKCRKAKAEEKLIKLSDGDGLFLHVYPNGKKLWRMSYRHAGKQRDMPFGPYPLVSLLEAREKRYAARKLLLDGKDPATEKKAEEVAAAQREETTFAAYANIYLDRLAKAGRSEPSAKSVHPNVLQMALSASGQDRGSNAAASSFAAMSGADRTQLEYSKVRTRTASERYF